MLELKKYEENINNLIINQDILNILLFSDYSIFSSENKFIITSNGDNTFDNIALFNTENNTSINGKIICFLEKKIDLKTYLENNNQNYYNINTNSINNFDKSYFLYNSSYINDRYDKVLILMEDFEQLDFYNVSNFEIKNVSDFEIINEENKYRMKFIENISKLLIRLIKGELIKNELNEKGIYLILKILLQIIKYINKDDLIFIFEYFWKTYEINKSEENKYPFMSLEYLEKQLNKYFKFNNLKNIYKEKEDSNKNRNTLFHFTIKDNCLEINQNLEIINKYFKTNLTNPITIEQNNKFFDNINKIYSESYHLTNLSFNVSDDGITYRTFDENSIFFTKPIIDDKNLLELSGLIENNNNKFKVIIVNHIS